MRLIRIAVVVAAIPGVAALSAVVERFDAHADCLPYTGVAATGGRTYGIRSDGTLWRYGDLVEGNVVPAVPEGIDHVSRVSATGHTLALREGVVWSWGSNSDGQLGDGTPPLVTRSFPLPISGLPSTVDVAAGTWHSLSLSQTGKVWSWGLGHVGRLGDGTGSSRRTPLELTSLSGIVDVAAGKDHSLAVKSDGTVVAWGDNFFGELGDGTHNNHRTVPTPVIRVTGAVAVEGTQNDSLARKSDGTVWTWGSEPNIGSPTGPVQVSGLTGIVAISGNPNGDHWMALKSDGSVWTWGENGYGQIGNGLTTDRATPYKVLGLPPVVAITAGSVNSFAVDEDGRIWGWGHNGNGQLGDGTRTHRYTPVRAQDVVQCFVPDLASTPSPSPAATVSPLPTPTVSGPSGIGEEAPVADCTFARTQGEIVYGGYALTSNETPPLLTTIKCSVQTGSVYGERTATAPGAVASVVGTVSASPAPVTVCTYAEAVYEGNRVVATSRCVES